MRELVHSRDMRAWQARLREGNLSLQIDPQTGIAQFYPRPVNLAAPGRPLEWRDASGVAELIACTVVRVGASLARRPPYLFGLVRLAEGPRMLAIIEGDPEQVPAPGTSLRVVVNPDSTPNLTFRVPTP